MQNGDNGVCCCATSSTSLNVCLKHFENVTLPIPTITWLYILQENQNVNCYNSICNGNNSSAQRLREAGGQHQTPFRHKNVQIK